MYDVASRNVLICEMRTFRSGIRNIILSIYRYSKTNNVGYLWKFRIGWNIRDTISEIRKCRIDALRSSAFLFIGGCSSFDHPYKWNIWVARRRWRIVNLFVLLLSLIALHRIIGRGGRLMTEWNSGSQSCHFISTRRTITTIVRIRTAWRWVPIAFFA